MKSKEDVSSAIRELYKQRYERRRYNSGKINYGSDPVLEELNGQIEALEWVLEWVDFLPCTKSLRPCPVTDPIPELPDIIPDLPHGEN